MAAMPVRDTSTSPSSVMSWMNCLDLRRLAGHLEDEMLGRRVDDLGAEDLGDAQGLDALFALAGDLDQRQLALQRIALDGQIAHAVHGNEPLELMLDLLDDSRACRCVTMVMRDRCFSCSVSVTVRLVDVVAAARRTAR